MQIAGNLDSYLSDLLKAPDPQLLAGQEEFKKVEISIKQRIFDANKRALGAVSQAEKAEARHQEQTAIDELRKHRLNYHAFIDQPVIKPLPSLGNERQIG